MQKNKPKRGILFFVKYPTKGSVKKRLTTDVDEQFVADLYTCFVEDILSYLHSVDYDVLICYHPIDHESLFQQWLGTNYQYIPQRGNNLGERMCHCFSYGFKLGYDQLVVIGSDSPDLPTSFFTTAFDSLMSYDAVIGPCTDGGYYLFGCDHSNFIAEVFFDIPWSTSVVFNETMRVLHDHKRQVYKLPLWNDVDILDDLMDLYDRNKTSWFSTSKTMKMIQNYMHNQQ